MHAFLQSKVIAKIGKAALDFMAWLEINNSQATIEKVGTDFITQKRVTSILHFMCSFHAIINALR